MTARPDGISVWFWFWRCVQAAPRRPRDKRRHTHGYIKVGLLRRTSLSSLVFSTTLKSLRSISRCCKQSIFIGFLATVVGGDVGGWTREAKGRSKDWQSPQPVRGQETVDPRVLWVILLGETVGFADSTDEDK